MSPIRFDRCRWMLWIVALLAAGCAMVNHRAWAEDSLAARQDAAAERRPRGFPPVLVPQDNPLTAEKAALGAMLFQDRRLSADGKISCASCHDSKHGFADSAPLSKGVDGLLGDFNAPTLINVAYFPALMGNGRALNLEDQVRYPVTHPKEMNMTRQSVTDFVNADPEYLSRFQAVFNVDKATFAEVSKAIASFERTLIFGDSPFDRYYFDGDSQAITPAAERGWRLFSQRARCSQCHTFSDDNPFFTDHKYHNLGIGFDGPQPALGRYLITRERQDKGGFRTPSLRDVARTAPYMHDGRFKTLEEAVHFHLEGGYPNPFLDEELRPVKMTPEEVGDLVAFLRALTSDDGLGEKP